MTLIDIYLLSSGAMDRSLDYWELAVLCSFILGPLGVDLALLFLSAWGAKIESRIVLVLPVPLYVALNVAAPLLVIWQFFRDEWGWVLALFLFVKALEFGPFKIGGMYLDILIDSENRRLAARRSNRPTG